MFFKTLSVTNFKNLKDTDLLFSDKLNCFTGKNGAGKTNLLDAIYYLCLTKSFFNLKDSQNINYNADYFVIRGEVIKNNKTETIFCGYSESKKKIFKRNEKAYNKFSDHIGLFPVTIISPDDISLINGPAEERRKYADSVIAQYDKEYLYELIKYHKVLAQRNRLLKNYNNYGKLDYETVEIYNDQLSDSAKIIYNKRKEFILNLIPIFSNYYKIISKQKESINLTYQSNLNEEELLVLLTKSLEKDKILGYTTIGIHRDDLIFEINDHSLRKSGSQGQQKTFLTALKFAQYDFIKSISKLNPILLLDDIFDKFDSERVEEIIKLTGNNNFGQLFITDTNPTRVRRIIDTDKKNFKLFNVENGIVSNEEF